MQELGFSGLPLCPSVTVVPPFDSKVVSDTLPFPMTMEQEGTGMLLHIASAEHLKSVATMMSTTTYALLFQSTCSDGPHRVEVRTLVVCGRALASVMKTGGGGFQCADTTPTHSRAITVRHGTEWVVLEAARSLACDVAFVDVVVDNESIKILGVDTAPDVCTFASIAGVDVCRLIVDAVNIRAGQWFKRGTSSRSGRSDAPPSTASPSARSATSRGDRPPVPPHGPSFTAGAAGHRVAASTAVVMVGRETPVEQQLAMKPIGYQRQPVAHRLSALIIAEEEDDVTTQHSGVTATATSPAFGGSLSGADERSSAAWARRDADDVDGDDDGGGGGDDDNDDDDDVRRSGEDDTPARHGGRSGPSYHSAATRALASTSGGKVPMPSPISSDGGLRYVRLTDMFGQAGSHGAASTLGRSRVTDGDHIDPMDDVAA